MIEEYENIDAEDEDDGGDFWNNSAVAEKKEEAESEENQVQMTTSKLVKNKNVEKALNVNFFLDIPGFDEDLLIRIVDKTQILH